MKMVSAAKYARAQRELNPARTYGLGAREFYEKVEAQDDKDKKNHLVLAISSDRGLCGGIHNSVAKYIKAQHEEAGADSQLKIMIVGDRAKAILGRTHSEFIKMSFNDYGKRPPIFGDASLVASAILNSGEEYDKASLIFNRFKSVISYDTTSLPLFSADAIKAAEKFNAYDSVDDDVMQSYMEFSLASIIMYAMKEGACSEQSARMTAMESSSKNAGEMIEKLTMTFNRTRQAVITGELIEIISGAAAL